MTDYIIPFLKGLPTIAFSKTANRLADYQQLANKTSYHLGQQLGELSALTVFAYTVSQIPDNPALFVATGATLLLTNLASDHYEATQKQ